MTLDELLMPLETTEVNFAYRIYVKGSSLVRGILKLKVIINMKENLHAVCDRQLEKGREVSCNLNPVLASSYENRASLLVFAYRSCHSHIKTKLVNYALA